MSETESIKKESNAGSYYLLGIGFAVALVGAVFVWLMWRSVTRTVETLDWEKTACVIMLSSVKERSEKHISKEYSWNLEYSYTYKGKSYSSTFNTPRANKWTSRKKEISDKVDEFPVNHNAYCYVDPAVPTRAILTHESKAAGYSIWFPSLFVIGGMGVMVGALRGIIKTNRANSAHAESAKS